MDKLASYRDIIKALIREIDSWIPAEDGDVRQYAIIDDEGGHYLLYCTGWEGEVKGYVYGATIHFDLMPDGKVWLQHNGTDLKVASMLVERGIAREDIVLGFHAPYMRQFTEFAAG